MNKQSISLTSSNNEWLKSQVEQGEYNSKSELVNDLVKKARAKQERAEFIQNKLIQAEQKGFTAEIQNEILAEINKDFIAK